MVDAEPTALIIKHCCSDGILLVEQLLASVNTIVP